MEGVHVTAECPPCVTSGHLCCGWSVRFLPWADSSPLRRLGDINHDDPKFSSASNAHGETMQSTCPLDHSVEVTIPSFLCRACHPELNARVASQPDLTAEAEMLRTPAEEAAHQAQASCQAAIAA